MFKKATLFACLVLAAVIMMSVGYAADNETGRLYILPEIFPVPEGGEQAECAHVFGEAEALDTVTIDLDEYYHCYMEITVNAKTCEKCGITAYDLDYELFPHEGTGMFCERCGKHLVPPVIAAPLDE